MGHTFNGWGQFDAISCG